MTSLRSILIKLAQRVDWLVLAAATLITAAGMVTMYSFGTDTGHFDRQLVSLVLAIGLFLAMSLMDFRFLRNTSVVVTLFLGSALLLAALFVTGHVAKGAQSWFRIGGFSFQPSDPAKIILVILLSKYFSRRHVEIKNIRHVIVSGFYAFIIFALIFVQPDFGSAITIFLLWFGMVLVSGISYKHIIAVATIGIVGFAALWGFVFQDYQKARIMTFIHPLADVRGAGYNAFQSMIAVGSGEITGKGIGYGTQSRLKFLPEYQTDFIFAAFSEEWGFIGAFILFLLYLFIILRVVRYALRGESNFEILFCLGIAIMLLTHVVINIGMNVGLLPVTGVALPLMSYGGSHLLAEYGSLGIVMGMRGYSRGTHKDAVNKELELFS